MLPDRAPRRSGSPIFRATVAAVFSCDCSGVTLVCRMRPTPFLLRLILNPWPLFLFACIRVCAIKTDIRSQEVELRMRPWNRN
jgi:hypothetical protein